MPEYRTLKHPEPFIAGDEVGWAEGTPEFQRNGHAWAPLDSSDAGYFPGLVYRRPVDGEQSESIRNANEQLATEEVMTHERRGQPDRPACDQATSGPVTEAPVTAASVIAKAGGEIGYEVRGTPFRWSWGDGAPEVMGCWQNQGQPLMWHYYMEFPQEHIDALVQATHSQALAGFEEVECPRCKGNGRVEMLEHCPVCPGTGKLYRKTQEGGK